MKPNEAGLDRAIRIALGIALLAWGWIGLVPLATGLVGFCPLYRVFGFARCPLGKRRTA